MCLSGLVLDKNYLKWSSVGCDRIFPFVGQIPILINEDESVFEIKEFLNKKDIFFKIKKRNSIVSLLSKIVPNITLNIISKRNYIFLKSLLKYFEKPRILIIGGSVVGEGLRYLYDSRFEIIETDISFGDQTQIICDTHNLPFKSKTFDCVIAQAVLENVLDPHNCVKEIYRVLKDDGLVYSEIPFMQQVHGGCYDFIRFTHLGYRKLLNKFTEIKNGVVCSTGKSLTWAYRYFLLSFSKAHLIRNLIKVLANFTSFYLKYFDYFLIKMVL